MSSGRGGYQQSLDKGPKRPVFSKTTARDNFRWAVAQPYWEAFLKERGKAADPTKKQELGRDFREQMRPLWREFWSAAKELSRDGLSKLTHEHHLRAVETLKKLEQRHPSPSEIGRERGPSLSPADMGDKQQGGGPVHGSTEPAKAKPSTDKVDFGTWKDCVAARQEQAERQATHKQQKDQATQGQEREGGQGR
jgi:hypothetical protein